MYQQSFLTPQVVKKVAAEKAPATGKWSDRPQAADASHAVKRDVEYKLVSDPDVVIDGDHKTKAYQVRDLQSGFTVDLAPWCAGVTA